MAKGRLLLVEDDREIAFVVCNYLRKQGFIVTWASTGIEGWEDFANGSYDLVLVDVMLPEMNGFRLCQNIRLSSDVPILIISARREDEMKVEGLETGADDYIMKPFTLTELSARITSHLRRYKRYLGAAEKEQLLSFNDGLVIDKEKKLVMLQGENLAVTVKEYELLLFLAEHPLHVFSKGELYEHLWKQPSDFENNTITVHMKSLRSKLGENLKQPRFIATVWGKGYRFIGELIK